LLDLGFVDRKNSLGVNRRDFGGQNSSRERSCSSLNDALFPSRLYYSLHISLLRPSPVNL
jgi:hypothetical protein